MNPVRPTATIPPALTVVDAAALLTVSNRTVWRMLADGRLRGIHVGSRLVVLGTSIERLLSPEAKAMTTSGDGDVGPRSAACESRTDSAR